MTRGQEHFSVFFLRFSFYFFALVQRIHWLALSTITRLPLLSSSTRFRRSILNLWLWRLLNAETRKIFLIGSLHEQKNVPRIHCVETKGVMCLPHLWPQSLAFARENQKEKNQNIQLHGWSMFFWKFVKKSKASGFFCQSLDYCVNPPIYRTTPS